MRIAFFTDSFYPELGGIQDSIMLTARALGERGHQIMVYAPSASPRDYFRAGLPVQEIDLGERVQVRRLFSVPVPSSTGQSRLLLPTGRRWRELADWRPDVLHTHTFLGAGWEALVAARRLGVPLVGTNHWAIGEFSMYAPIGARQFARYSVKAATAYYNRCDFVTGPSHSVIDEMRVYGLRKPARVVSNPIDTVLFRPGNAGERQALKRRLGFSDATILYAGRLAVEKNIDVLIRAFASVAREIPDAIFALAGHGSDRPRLARLAEELGVGQQVRFLGTLDKPALADAYRAADVFAIASTSETQSMVLLQAMSSGLAAVGARWRALPEYIGDDAGLLAEPGDAAQFAAHLLSMLRTPSMRAQMGERATAIARRFGLAETVSAWEQIYAAQGAAHGIRQHNTEGAFE
ncbi:MAG: glycosyltransferase [Bordetella sp.]|uniref:glycosyltransferase n=1 Tax=Bordetella sp. TaxID=28081 RepID=UPI003F7CA4BF